MSRKLCAALAVAATITASAAGAVSLDGVEFEATTDALGNPLYEFAPSTFTVGAGIETYAEYGADKDYSFDFSDGGLLEVKFLLDFANAIFVDGLSFDFTALAPAGFPAFNGFQLTSASGVLGLDQSDLSFTGNTLSIHMDETYWEVGSGFTAQVSTVPLPATLPLLAAGLAGLALLRRRRDATAAA